VVNRTCHNLSAWQALGQNGDRHCGNARTVTAALPSRAARTIRGAAPAVAIGAVHHLAMKGMHKMIYQPLNFRG